MHRLERESTTGERDTIMHAITRVITKQGHHANTPRVNRTKQRLCAAKRVLAELQAPAIMRVRVSFYTC